MADEDYQRNNDKLFGVLIMITEKELELMLNTLEKIEVHGFDNLDKLLALIQFIKNKLNESEEDDD